MKEKVFMICSYFLIVFSVVIVVLFISGFIMIRYSGYLYTMLYAVYKLINPFVGIVAAATVLFMMVEVLLKKKEVNLLITIAPILYLFSWVTVIVIEKLFVVLALRG